jgi:hypothetical protein
MIQIITPQRVQWIDADRAPGWEVGAEEGDRDEGSVAHEERDGIAGAHSIEQGGLGAGEEEGAGEARARLSATSFMPSPTTRLRMRADSSPSAMRMPISFVRWLTAQAITP